MTPRRPLAAALLAVLLAATAGACGGDGDKGKDTKVTTGSTASGEKTEGTAVSLKALLNPAEEVPGPGVKDGIGRVGIDVAGPKVCSDVKVTMGEKPVAAHIHKGAMGMSGPVVVDLKPVFESGESAYMSKTCVDTTAATASQLIADPAAYYVNIHSDGHPDGAMRGQLSKF